MPQEGDCWGKTAWCKSITYFGNDSLSLKSSPADNWVMVVTDYDPANTNKRRRTNRKQLSRPERLEAVKNLLVKAGAAMQKQSKKKTKETNVAASAVDSSPSASAGASRKKRQSKKKTKDTNVAESGVDSSSSADAGVSSNKKQSKKNTKETNVAESGVDSSSSAAAVETTTDSLSDRVLGLIANHDWVALHKLAVEVYDDLSEPSNPLEGWRPQMPIWLYKGCKRSLLGYGQTRTNPNPDPDVKDVKGKIYNKVGAIPELCAKILFEAVETWMREFGTPPVIAGESVLKAIREGRFPVGYEPPRHRGYTRGQTVLVRCVGPRSMDLKTPFLLSTTVLYCKNLVPPVEEGTDSYDAVLGFLREKRVFSALMANVRTSPPPLPSSCSLNPYPYHP